MFSKKRQHRGNAGRFISRNRSGNSHQKNTSEKTYRRMPGIGAIEVAIVLIILVVGISASCREYAKYVNNMTHQAAADTLNTLTNAALQSTTSEDVSVRTE